MQIYHGTCPANGLPVCAGTITGHTTVCNSQLSATYTVPPIANANSYIWTLPNGFTGTSDTNSITVNVGYNAVPGYITVAGNNDCGTGSISSLYVDLGNWPSQPTDIVGDTSVCQGQNSIKYYIPTITNSTSYDWSIPNGATAIIYSDSIIVNFGKNAQSGYITVCGVNECGKGPSSMLYINVKSLQQVSLALAQEQVCMDVDSIQLQGGWPVGGIYSGQGILNNQYFYPQVAGVGSYYITYINTTSEGCSSSAQDLITVNPTTFLYFQLDTNMLCINSNPLFLHAMPSGGSYSGTGVSGNWFNPSISGIGIFPITYTYIHPISGCINKISDTITVDSYIGAADSISGLTTVCHGQLGVTYTVPPIANAISYVWTLPNGATGFSNTNTITINYDGIIAGGGGNEITINYIGIPDGESRNKNISINTEISVKCSNSCGDEIVSTLPIIINLKPEKPVIFLNDLILESNSSIGNQWYNQNGIINGETNKKYTVNASGDYYVIISNNGCCSEPSNTINVTVTSFEEIESGRVIKIYPNPITTELIIEIEGNTKIINFEIFNAIGQVVYKSNLIEKTIIQTSDFAKGVYLLKLENGETYEIKKIIKKY